MSISQIYQDASLYGHTLTSLPQKLWAFSQDELCLREHLDSLPIVDRNDIDSYRNDQSRGDYLFVGSDFVVAKYVEYRKGQGTHQRTILVIGNPLIDLIEFIGRRILGSFATAVSLFTSLPIGFVTKIIHRGIRHINTYIASTWLAEKTSQIWNDSSLYGHYLTCLPKKLWAFAVSDKLVFYTTGRIFWIFENHIKKETTANGNTIQVTGETLPPLWTYAECGFRRIVGTCLTAGACITAAPLGFAIKIIHKGILKASSKN